MGTRQSFAPQARTIPSTFVPALVLCESRLVRYIFCWSRSILFYYNKCDGGQIKQIRPKSVRLLGEAISSTSLNNKKTDLVLIKLLLYRITKMYIYCFSDILIAAFT